MEWMLGCPTEVGAEQSVMRLSRTQDLVTLPLGQLAGADAESEAGVPPAPEGLGDDLLTVRRYTVAVARADDRRWIGD